MQPTALPQRTDPAEAALVLLALAIEALALALRPLLAHGLALVLTLAGWRPTPAAPAPLEKRPEPIKAQPIAAPRRRGRPRKVQQVAA